MIYKDEKLHNKYVINIIFDGASPWNYLQTTEMGSLMCAKTVEYVIHITTVLGIVYITVEFIFDHQTHPFNAFQLNEM